MNQKMQGNQVPMDISDEDVLEAMKSINGYLDITPGDFKEIYILAFKLALERLRRSVKAREIMTTKIISITRDASLLKAAELMALYNISGLPVVDLSEHVVGIISENDFLYEMGEKEKQTFMGVIVQCLKNKGCTAVSLRNQTVGEIMSSPPINRFRRYTSI